MLMAKKWQRYSHSVGSNDAIITVTSIPYESPEDTSQLCHFIKVLIPGSEGNTVEALT